MSWTLNVYVLIFLVDSSSESEYSDCDSEEPVTTSLHRVPSEYDFPPPTGTPPLAHTPRSVSPPLKHAGASPKHQPNVDPAAM